MPTDDKLARGIRLRGDLPYYSAELLQVRSKTEKIVPFIFNNAQLELHRRIEEQRAATGFVRALVLKGRQQGISTYTAARFYQRSSTRRGVNVYILAHEQNASDNLFGIVDRYQRHNPLAPSVGASNAKELVFDLLDSTYTVATAGTKAGGRSRTISLFHGSEVAFWANANDHFAASVQGVPNSPGTEIILESTSAGASGEFYNRWLEAEAGRGDYICVFLPWWLTDEYQREPPPGFELEKEQPNPDTMSEQEYADTWHLSLAQMAWRRFKIYELRSLELFQREYPACPAEAWTFTAGKEPFIKPLSVMRARKRQVEGVGPLIIGVDPASMGGDRFSITARRGMRAEWTRYRNKIDHNEGTLWIRSLIDELQPARVNIDLGNIGVTIVTNLKTLGPKYAEIVRGVNFGATSQCKTAKPKVPGPKNRRAEMWARTRDWLNEPEGLFASIPDDDALQTDLTAPCMKPLTSNDYYLESKEDMKKRGIRSPDLADSLALTFATNEVFTNYHTPGATPQFAAIDAPSNNAVQQRRATLPAGRNGWMG
jgi:hypothetical protein